MKKQQARSSEYLSFSLCHSKYFMKSDGGFSNLIEAYVRENGGIVFSEKNEGYDKSIPIR